MHKIYLAARYSRHPEMREIRDQLHRLGYVVTSRWIDCHPDVVGELGAHEDSATFEQMNENPETCEVFARHDLDDVMAADTLVLFTEGGGGKGGRHTEFGFAIGQGKGLIIVGPRENVFHCLSWPGLQVYPTVYAFLIDASLAAVAIGHPNSPTIVQGLVQGDGVTQTNHFH